jgi:malonic semialdehyde reductase
MWTIKQPSKIIFGKNSAKDFSFPNSYLVITSPGSTSRGWLDYCELSKNMVFDEVEPNPSIETTEKIIQKFKNHNFTHIVGIGGGSSMDVAKYCAFKLKKKKIMIPTTFGSGSEVTKISVLTVDGKKKSFHDDKIIADVAIVDPFFINNTPIDIIKNSAIDACAQCSEAFDSKNSNPHTKFLCSTAFDILEQAILNENYENLPLGSLISGLGFGNSSTTLGHALSYVFSNEGVSHGHALAFTTTIAHKFNTSKFYDRFYTLVKKLKFEKISLKQNLNLAAELILTDRKHLDNNPKNVVKTDIMNLLFEINKF